MFLQLSSEGHQSHYALKSTGLKRPASLSNILSRFWGVEVEEAMIL